MIRELRTPEGYARDWSPFSLAEIGKRGDRPRSLDSAEGISDRLRSAAFAEIQAREGFRWAAGFFPAAPAPLKRAWLALADAEDRHLGWLLGRMEELGVSPAERKVSDYLWRSFLSCKSAEEFATYMASAEEWGRKAGESFFIHLQDRDPITAEIFRKIAEEEVAHIQLALKYFPEAVHRLH